MGRIAQPIVESLKVSDFVIDTATRDVDDAVARRRARGTEGASMTWILGHLLHFRHEMLALIGKDSDDPFAHFRDGSTVESDYPPFADLVAAWQATSARLMPAMTGAPDEVFARPAGTRTVLEAVAGLAWHEAYHIGQLGTLRAQFGLTDVNTLASGER